MYTSICFFNPYHAGDIHVSRSFVRYIIEQQFVEKYYYQHNNSERLLLDLSLSFINYSIPDNFNHIGNFIKNNTLYLNTWYWTYNKKFAHHGLTIQLLYELFSYTLKEVFNHTLQVSIESLLPSINYNFYATGGICKFISTVNKPIVLICNNNTMSGQAVNFDFNPIIEYVSKSFPNLLFVISNDTGYLFPNNVIYFRNIIGREHDNLNELSYFSTFCNTIIGRASGPQTVAFVRENILDNKKTFIVFASTDFGVLNLNVENKAKMVWNPDCNNVSKIISNVLNTI